MTNPTTDNMPPDPEPNETIVVEVTRNDDKKEHETRER